MKLQFRAEVYNLTNTENFGQPNVTITKWSSTLPGAMPILGAGEFGQIAGSNLALNPRQYQFAVKLIFRYEAFSLWEIGCMPLGFAIADCAQ